MASYTDERRISTFEIMQLISSLRIPSLVLTVFMIVKWKVFLTVRIDILFRKHFYSTIQHTLSFLAFVELLKLIRHPE